METTKTGSELLTKGKSFGLAKKHKDKAATADGTSASLRHLM